MTRPLATLAALALLWAAHAPSPAEGSYVALYDSTSLGTTTSIAFESNGFLHGSLAITTAELHDDFGHILRSIPITNGILTFALGPPTPSTLGRFTYSSGGLLSLTGNLGSGPNEVILSTGRLFGAASGPDSTEPGTYRLVDTALFATGLSEPGTLAADFLEAFGAPGLLSVFSVSGFGGPGTVTTAAMGGSGGIAVELAPAVGAVPEPASLAMLGLAAMGGGLAWLVRGMKRIGRKPRVC